MYKGSQGGECICRLDLASGAMRPPGLVWDEGALARMHGWLDDRSGHHFPCAFFPSHLKLSRFFYVATTREVTSNQLLPRRQCRPSAVSSSTTLFTLPSLVTSRPARTRLSRGGESAFCTTNFHHGSYRLPMSKLILFGMLHCMCAMNSRVLVSIIRSTGAEG